MIDVTLGLTAEPCPVSVCLKDSTDMTEADVSALTTACCEACTRKILVTHGTSTIVRSARAVAVALASLSPGSASDKTVVLTGSLRPRVFTETDADFNLGLAVGALSALPPGSDPSLSFTHCRHDACHVVLQWVKSRDH